MMKIYFYSLAGKLALLFAGVAMLSSCIKDEAMNAEADIVSCELAGDLLIREPVVTNDEVRLYVNAWDDRTQLAPTFKLTDGATIEPASGTVRDFTEPQTYVVTSQDGRWKKTYKVSFLSDDPATEYHFENIKFYSNDDDNDESTPDKQYFHIFIDKTTDNQDMEWGSGNAGYMILHKSAPATDYPTCQADGGVEGKCAKLTTMSTGTWGAFMGAPIAAGNLFLGTFEINMRNMAKSSHFGIPFRKRPTALTGYYKYKAGEQVTDKDNKPVTGKRDEFNIYAVLYEVTDDVPYLDGTNSLTSPNIVMKAVLQDKKETDEWTHFSVEFTPVNDATIDEKKLADGKYNIAIVMSSSINGATFEGAVGSTLYVDEMTLYYE